MRALTFLGHGWLSAAGSSWGADEGMRVQKLLQLWPDVVAMPMAPRPIILQAAEPGWGRTYNKSTL